MEEETFYQIIKDGIQAPSGDNIQPWKISPYEDLRGFTLSVTVKEGDFFDVKNIASYFSCGTFLENIRISASNFGYEIKIDILDNEKLDTNNVAKISFRKLKTEYNNELYQEIYRRATSREPYSKKDLEDNFYEKLNSNKINENITFKLFNSKPKSLIDLMYKVEIIRFQTKGAFETLASNIKTNIREVEETREGLDYRSLGMPIFPKMTSKILKIWKLNKLLLTVSGEKIVANISSKRLLNNSAGIGIIYSKKFDKENIIYSGMEFQRIWLYVSKYGGYLQPFAPLSLFIKRVELLPKEETGFSNKNYNLLLDYKNRFHEITQIDSNEQVMMLFRYGFAKKPKVYSLRKDIKEFIQK